MTQLQTVLGFFDTIAEAQQAVQRLLARGFTDKTVELSTPINSLSTSAGVPPPALVESDSSSGRFFSALFDRQTEVRFRNLTLVSVQTQSAVEARQVTDLLIKAGAALESYPLT